MIFAGNVEKNVLPAVAPVRRQTVRHPFRPLGQKKKHHVRPLFYDSPGLIPPAVRLLQEKNSDVMHTLSCRRSSPGNPPPLSFCSGIVKIIFHLVNTATVRISLPVEKIHVTIITAFAFLTHPCHGFQMSCIFRSSFCQQAVCRLCRFPAAFIQTSAALQILELLLLKPSPPRYSAASAGTFSVHNENRFSGKRSLPVV